VLYGIVPSLGLCRRGRGELCEWCERVRESFFFSELIKAEEILWEGFSGGDDNNYSSKSLQTQKKEQANDRSLEDFLNAARQKRV
jgi:hypothetical protein